MTAVCKFHVRDSCTTAGCKFDHAVVDTAKNYGVCVFNLIDKCNKAATCSFRHVKAEDVRGLPEEIDPVAYAVRELDACRDFLVGTCERGDKCR